MAKKVSIKRTNKTVKPVSSPSYLEKLEKEVETNQSKVSLILGALIVLVIGILVFNYFNRNKAALGPAQQTQNETANQDVSPDQLPGKYTVKEGDTLFIIAEKYYKDGSKFADIAKANSLTNVDQITTGQVLDIPKAAADQVQASAEPVVSPSPEVTATPEPSVSPAPTTTPDDQTAVGTGTGGGNTTIWGPRIEGDTYTVVVGDWLSTIAGRAYGDIMAYQKIAQANNISNPDHIEPGMVLKIPR